LDELRSLDWVPRSTRAKSRELEKTTSKLQNQLGRTPSDRELAKSMRISSGELFSTMDDVASTTMLSLDELIYKEEDNRQIPRVETLEDLGSESVLGDLEQEELKAYLIQAISHLSEQERLVVALYYYEELTLKEIGEVMQISESRVSQIHTKAVLKLRGMIKEKFAQ
jgi:RNA polymerase sigma factor for flagellar operon FliA